MNKVVYILIIVLILTSCSKTSTSNNFDINAKVTDDILCLSIDSDLPDLTNIIITVSRSYKIKGDSTDYTLNYKLDDYNNNTFRESYLSVWRNVNQISLNNLDWVSKLNSKQDYMDYYDSLDSINDSIIVKIDIPVSQTNTKIIKTNNNSSIDKDLKNKSISKSVSIYYPLLRKEELLSHESFIIKIENIPKTTNKNYLSISGRVNSNYILFINDEKKDVIDSDMFMYYTNLIEGINSISFKVLDASGKCVYNKNYYVEYETLRSHYLNMRSLYIDKCYTINYRKLRKDPLRYKGNQYKFTGKVIEIAEDKNGAIVTLAVGSSTHRFDYSHRLYGVTNQNIEYISEGDIITIYGNIIGSSNKITWDDSPIMRIEYCDHEDYGVYF